MKVLIFDASTLISLAMNGLLPELEKLKNIFDGKFIITDDVRYEAIERPMNIKRFKLDGLQLNRLMKLGVLEGPEVLGVDEKNIEKITKQLMSIANSSFKRKGKDIQILDKGEADCLALSKILNEKKIENLLAIDERTTRVLCEKPDNLKKLLERKLHSRVEVQRKNFKMFKDFKIIRSAELVYIFWKKGLVEIKDKNVLDALLYAVKFKGCSITDQEIEEIKRIG